MAIAAVVFDWDNTLVDSFGLIVAALNGVLREWALPEWTEAEARERIRGAVRETFPGLFGAEWERAAVMLRETMATQALDGLRLMSGAAEAVAAAGAYPAAIVSNKEGAALRREVAHLGWSGRFGAIVGAGDASADKPHPAPIWHALGLIGVNPGPGVWYVGDTGSDMQAARAAGCMAVLVGDAAHDGGLGVLEETGMAPHLVLSDAHSLAARLRAARGAA